MRRLVSPLLLVVVVAVSSTRAVAQPLTENFDSGAALIAAGWVFVNNGNPAGTTSWFQGNTDVFTSQGGAANSYGAANLNGATFGGNISDWLITPTLTNLRNGEVLTFYTRTEAAAPAADRLEVRLSTNGSSSNAGATDTSVGDFTTLLLTVNPALTVGGYPSAWTLFTVTLSGLPPGPNTGRIAFRHFVPDTSVNGDYIGIDTLSLTVPPGADLSITNVPSSGTVTGGTNVTYSIGVTNYGPNQADAVTVTYNLPSPLSFVSCLATNGGVCGGSGNNRTVTYGSIASAASSTITMVAALPCSAADGSVVTGTATVSSASTPDPDAGNNSAMASFTVSGALPAPAVTAPGTVGEGSPNRAASVPDNAGSTYAWTIGNGTITAGQGTSQITFTGGASGTPLTLSCVETDASGCVSAPGAATVTVGPPGSAVLYYPVPSCRVLDTRHPAGTYGGPALQPSATRSWALAAQCGIPADARAVSANITVVGPTMPGFLTLYPGGSTRPLTSSINFSEGQTRASNVILQVSTDGTGTFNVFTGSLGTVDFVFDVNGFLR